MSSAQVLTTKSARGPRKNKFRKTPKSTKGKLYSLKKEVSTIKKDLKKTVEIKSVDSYALPTNIGWNGSFINDLNLTTAGTGSVNRIGDTITMTGFELKWVANLASSLVPSVLRVILFIDHENNLIRDNILDNRASNALTINAPLMFYTRTTRNDFEILYDECHTFDTTEQLQVSKRVHQSFNKEVKFATLPSSNGITENALRLLVISNRSNAGADQPVFQYMCRVYFKDS